MRNRYDLEATKLTLQATGALGHRQARRGYLVSEGHVWGPVGSGKDKLAKRTEEGSLWEPKAAFLFTNQLIKSRPGRKGKSKEPRQPEWVQEPHGHQGLSQPPLGLNPVISFQSSTRGLVQEKWAAFHMLDYCCKGMESLSSF